MNQIDKMLAQLPSYFDVSPDKVLAFRISPLRDNFCWEVDNHVFRAFQGETPVCSIDLSSLTIGELARQLNATGAAELLDVRVPANTPAIAVMNPVNVNLSLSHQLKIALLTLLDALGLLGGAGASNPAHADLTAADGTLQAMDRAVLDSNEVSLYRSLLWRFVDLFATELAVAGEGVEAALDQMSVPTADGDWLDAWGAFFSVFRASGEPDADYGRRVIVEVVRPKQSNIAIALAIEQAFGQRCEVVDVVDWQSFVIYHDANAEVGPFHFFDGTYRYADTNRRAYGRFDVVADYDLVSGAELSGYAGSVRALVDRFRAAGTQMRALALGNSAMVDSASRPSDEAELTIVVGGVARAPTAL